MYLYFLMTLLVVFLLATVHLVGLVTIGSVFGISSICGSSIDVPVGAVGNATQSYYRPDEIAKSDNSIAGVTLPPDICQTLSNSNDLYRRHAPSPELSRLDQQYALSTDVLRTGFVRGRLQPSLLQKIARGEPITVLTLGNSFTRGHGCGETVFEDEMECSWPARFERWWQSYFMPNAASTFVHHAEHGATSVIALQRLAVVISGLPQPPDLILLDFLVTDVVTPDQSIGTIGYESLIRTTIELVPHAQIMLLEAGCRNCVNSQYVLHRRRQIAQRYDIPVVDYAAMVEFHNRRGPVEKRDKGPDLLWPTQDPDLDGPYVKVGAEWPNFQPILNTTKTACCPNNHPPWPVHQYVSDSFAYAFMELLKGKEGGCNLDDEKDPIGMSFHSQKDLAKYPSCTRPLVWHDSLASQNRSDIAPKTLQGKWRLFEDKPGRPGWITTELGSTISFPIRFSRVRPVLAITYLRSYANLGVAQVKFTAHSGKSNYVTLDGRWSKNFSLPDTAFFIDRPDGKSGNLLGDALESDGYELYGWGNEKKDTLVVEEYSIDITLIAGEKFKITQVISC